MIQENMVNKWQLLVTKFNIAKEWVSSTWDFSISFFDIFIFGKFWVFFCSNSFFISFFKMFHPAEQLIRKPQLTLPNKRLNQTTNHNKCPRKNHRRCSRLDSILQRWKLLASGRHHEGEALAGTRDTASRIECQKSSTGCQIRRPGTNSICPSNRKQPRDTDGFGQTTCVPSEWGPNLWWLGQRGEATATLEPQSQWQREVPETPWAERTKNDGRNQALDWQEQNRWWRQLAWGNGGLGAKIP